ncbi:MAG TPA: spore maturation protein [Candidatus Fimivivens faecavium]|nr:spore maturation protein [Candidatus Fimivivens faecavium]
MATISDFAVPSIIFGIIFYAMIRGVNVFDAFVKGARGGIGVSIRILPALVALITSVGIFRASGALDLLTYALEPVGNLLSLPREVLPLALLRPVSGSGALVIFKDILAEYGPDSLIGRIASVMEGSTETTFYTIAVYFGATSIKKTRHTMPAAISADLVGFLMSAYAVRLLMGP